MSVSKLFFLSFFLSLFIYLFAYLTDFKRFLLTGALVFSYLQHDHEIELSVVK